MNLGSCFDSQPRLVNCLIGRPAAYFCCVILIIIWVFKNKFYICCRFVLNMEWGTISSFAVFGRAVKLCLLELQHGFESCCTFFTILILKASMHSRQTDFSESPLMQVFKL